MTRRKKKSLDDGVDLNSLNEEGFFVGTPTMALLSARKYYFKLLKDKFVITIPREGTYNKLDPDFYKNESEKFNIFDESKNVVCLPAISHVLFGTNKYPDLAPNQLFIPEALVFNDDTVEIVGRLVEILSPPSV